MEQFAASNGATISTHNYGTFKTATVKTIDNEVSLAGIHVDALREFFLAEAARAHEASLNPWLNANPGEVWELTFTAGSHAWFVNGDFFQSTQTLTTIYKNDSGILSARRIWPEES